MAQTNFSIPANNYLTTAASTRSIGGTSLVVSSATGLPSLTGSQYFRLSIFSGGLPTTILKATGLNVGTKTFTISGTADGYADAQVNVGDQVSICDTAGSFSDIHAAVNAIEARDLNLASYIAAAGGNVDTGMANAIAALGTAGGRIFVPAGTYTFTQPINLDRKTSIILEGVGGVSEGITNTSGSVLLYTGTSPAWTTYSTTVNGFISVRSSQGVNLRNLRIRYNNTGFLGILVDASRYPSGNDTSEFNMENCGLSDVANSGCEDIPQALLCLDGSHAVHVKNCWFWGGQYCVLGKRQQGISQTGGGGYAIDVLFEGCNFEVPRYYAIKNADTSWRIASCVFEPAGPYGSTNVPGAYTQASGFFAHAITFEGCWLGDAGSDVNGAWFDFGAGGPYTIRGCEADGPSGSSIIRLHDNNVSGLVVMNNFFAGSGGTSVGIDFGSTTGHTGFICLGNSWLFITTPINGAIPTDSLYSTGTNALASSFGVTNVLSAYNASVTNVLTVQNESVLNNITALSATVAGLTNLLVDQQADFETGSYWVFNLNSTATRINTIASHGSWCMSCTCTTGGASSSIISQSGLTAPQISGGVHYYAMASVRADATPRFVSLEFYARDINGNPLPAGGQFFGQGTLTADSTSAWTQVFCNGIAPVGAASLQILVRWGQSGSYPATNEVHYLDEVMLSTGFTNSWIAPSATPTLALSGNAILQTGTNQQIDLGSNGTGALQMNVAVGSGTGGTVFGNGSGGTVASVSSSGVVTGSTLATGVGGVSLSTTYPGSLTDEINGAQLAGGTYTATEQKMLQTVYRLARSFKLLS